MKFLIGRVAVGFGLVSSITLGLAGIAWLVGVKLFLRFFRPLSFPQLRLALPNEAIEANLCLGSYSDWLGERTLEERRNLGHTI